MSTETNRKNLLELIEGMLSGQLMEKFEKFYADDVVMSENGVDDPERYGKEKNRAYEQYFVNNAEWHGARIGDVIADGDVTGYDMWMDLTFHGQRFQRNQFALQHWKDGKIVKEVFFYQG